MSIFGFIYGVGVGILIGFAISFWRWIEPLEDELDRVMGKKWAGTTIDRPAKKD